MGFVPVIAPCLVIEPRPADLPAPDAIQAILLPSGQAIAGLPAGYHGVPVLAVGDATAARARQAGFASVHSAARDAVALAGLAARLCTPEGAPLLLASGEGQSDALATDLRARGFRVVHRAVYAAAPVAELPGPALSALEAGELRAALFFSARTASAFVSALPGRLRPALAGTEALAIGTPAAAALQLLPWRCIRVAVRPTEDGMLALLR